MTSNYRLKNVSQAEAVKEICIYCGKQRSAEITPMSMRNGTVIRPNSSESFSVGIFQGTWLGCKLGSHKYYYKYELVARDTLTKF